MNTNTGRYTVTPDTEIGPDIDLAEEPVTGADGERVTEASTEEYTTARAEAARKGGRPSLGGRPGSSPPVAFRIPDELREEALAIAQREGRSISAIAREQLERYVAAHRDAA